MKTRIYVDTSVVGGCVDEEFQEYSIRLMECFVTGRYILVLSNLTVQELAAAPDEVRLHLSKVPEGHIETRQLDADARELAEAYISEGVIAGGMRADSAYRDGNCCPRRRARVFDRAARRGS